MGPRGSGKAPCFLPFPKLSQSVDERAFPDQPEWLFTAQGQLTLTQTADFSVSVFLNSTDVHSSALTFQTISQGTVTQLSHPARKPAV